ncbi:MAG: DUF885 domain-containing protein [Candidatus Krumholzibacteriia bacterium]
MKAMFVLGLAALCVGVSSCRDGAGADAAFVGLANRCLDGWRALDPEWATSLGDHRFDTQLTDRSAAGVARRATFARAYLDSLRALDESKLLTDNRIDRRILINSLESAVYAAETLREQDWNPLFYNAGGAVYALVARDFAPLAERLRAVKSRLEAMPAVLAAARTNLAHPPRLHVETAILQNDGLIGLVRDELEPFVAQEPALREELAPARAAAIVALADYGRWLRDDLLPRADGDFRLGAERFGRKLALTLESDLTPEQILESAKHDLDATQKEMVELARSLYAERFAGVAGRRAPSDREVVQAVLGRLAEERPTNADIVAKAGADLAACTAFVRDHDLVTVPDEPIRVIVMPEYQRGVAVAYCDASGPLEARQQTFFSIAPTPADWSPERTESFYREYNDDMLQDLTIHEAMPGHYLQIMHANAFRAPTLTRAILPNGPFVEGWATYAEQFMTAEGYGGPAVRMEQLKMRLRLIINAMLDQGIHAFGMSERQAMDLMMNEGFQEEGEAAGKWRRACLTAAQLSTYYVGNLEINRLRSEYATRQGGLYFGKLRAFHDQLLSYGAPAPKYVAELMGMKRPLPPWRPGRRGT